MTASNLDAQSALDSLSQRLWAIDDYAKVDVSVSYYHGIYVTARWEQDGYACTAVGWDADDLAVAAKTCIDESSAILSGKITSATTRMYQPA